jgi:hypothetical protein
LPSIALADVWRDISDATWRDAYGVSATEALVVAQGRSDGTFGPHERVNRGQFAKMTVRGLGISLEVPGTASFCDVAENHVFYCEVENCAAAGVMSGYADGSFRPDALVTREQSCSVLGRWLAEQEVALKGGIIGNAGSYPTLRAWFTAEGESCLATFTDAGRVSAAHQVSSAYLMARGVLTGSCSGSSTYLRPTSAINRAQAVALVLRAKQAAVALSRPLTPVEPGGPANVVLTGGQTPIKGIWSGTGDRLASYLLAICPSPRFTVPTPVIADLYVRYCAEAGLRADLLWAQMILETGYGMYEGDVSPEQNNYAGIGATGGGVAGAAFLTPEAGVMAQVAHMVAYVYTSSPVEWANSTTDPRFDLVSPRGAASVLADLNGRWAVPGTAYGQSIEAIVRAINAD